MSKFKVGDRVVCTGEHDSNKRIVNQTGTIKEIGGYLIGVVFDEDVNGHSCGDKCKYGYGWYVPERLLKPISDNKIVITTDGKTTLARLYEGNKVVKSAQAVCSPDDEFNFDYGARLAFDRLMDKPKYYSGKVVCVSAVPDETYFTIGKVYEYINGLIKSNLNMSGCSYNSTCPAKTKEEALNGRFVQFIEYKGENI